MYPRRGADGRGDLEGAVELVTEPREMVARQSTWIYTRYPGEAGCWRQNRRAGFTIRRTC
jgi:hypothetical protein